MPGRICRTPQEAFQAGWDETCDHDLDPGKCRVCGLTDTEIAQLVVLIGHLATPAPAGRAAA
ncbi:hypothetical protein [Streptomyces sp. 3214.6]|uniref:hypothetical protein n=1 Tax=Streptomyces sp. 3214.6 TaxID=1882757 RepID=UPI000909F195|nr:hypothetical protein [Streptomyces sp. 3214.6]SHI65184.1 hypothetical protein SAMN05444521_8140 [Streptomyces sp. 3214.6]